MSETPPQPADDAHPGADSILERLATLETRFAVIRREWREVAMEWESTYEKMRTIVARLSRRDERAEAKPDGNHKANPAALALLAGHDVRGG